MSILAWIVLGLVAGFIASMLVNRRGGSLLLDLLLGVIGALWRLTRDSPAQGALGAVSDAPAAAQPTSANSGLD